MNAMLVHLNVESEPCLHFCTLCTAARWWVFTNGITMRSLFIIHLSMWVSTT